MRWVVAFLVPVFVATLTLACEEEEKEQATATASPAVTATPTREATARPAVTVTATPGATPSPEVVETPEVTPAPEVEDEYEGWLTYTNDVYGYELRYPAAATVTEASETVFKVPAEEWQEGVTIHDVYERYTGKICVRVDYELGYVSISAPVNTGFRYAMCGRTGIAYEGRAREETLVIDGKTYSAGGWEEQGPGETLPFHSEMLLVTLDDGTRIEYGPMPVETATFEDYLQIREQLLTIVQSYRTLP